MTEPIGPGAFVAVVGASGVGKDALLSYARERAGAFARFPRRAITRPPGAGEEHDPVTEDHFAAARDRGTFAVFWRAHGLCYGLPALVDADVRDGLVVVANVSRSVIDELDRRYRRLVVVHVTVAEELRAQRLRARRREPEPGIGQRLARPDPAPGHRVDAVITNDGSLAEGGAQLLRVIRDAVHLDAGGAQADTRPKPDRSVLPIDADITWRYGDPSPALLHRGRGAAQLHQGRRSELRGPVRAEPADQPP